MKDREGGQLNSGLTEDKAAGIDVVEIKFRIRETDAGPYVEKQCECASCNAIFKEEKKLPRYVITYQVLRYENHVRKERRDCFYQELENFCRAIRERDADKVSDYLSMLSRHDEKNKLALEFMRTECKFIGGDDHLTLFAYALMQGGGKHDAKALEMFKKIIESLSIYYPNGKMKISDIMSMCFPDDVFDEDRGCLLRYLLGSFESEFDVGGYLDRWLYQVGILNTDYIRELNTFLRRLPRKNDSVLRINLAEEFITLDIDDKDLAVTTLIQKKKRLSMYYSRLRSHKGKKEVPIVNCSQEERSIDVLARFINGGDAGEKPLEDRNIRGHHNQRGNVAKKVTALVFGSDLSSSDSDSDSDYDLSLIVNNSSQSVKKKSKHAHEIAQAVSDITLESRFEEILTFSPVKKHAFKKHSGKRNLHSDRKMNKSMRIMTTPENGMASLESKKSSHGRVLPGNIGCLGCFSQVNGKNCSLFGAVSDACNKDLKYIDNPLLLGIPHSPIKYSKP